TLNNRHAYRVTNSLCKKAMVVELDTGSAAMEIFNNESNDLDDNQENVIPFDISTIQDLAVKK
ncbi:11074_t:CDS:2, partial [Gigaspora margarita]